MPRAVNLKIRLDTFPNAYFVSGYVSRIPHLLFQYCIECKHSADHKNVEMESNCPLSIGLKILAFLEGGPKSGAPYYVPQVYHHSKAHYSFSACHLRDTIHSTCAYIHVTIHVAFWFTCDGSISHKKTSAV